MGLGQVRAVRQMLLGLVPLVVLAIVLIVVMSLRLADASAPLRAATSTAEAVIVSTGLGVDGRQIAVEYTDGTGAMQTGRLTLATVQDIPLDERISVVYDPDRPSVVYARGDAQTAVVDDLAGGLLIVTVILIAVSAVTVVRLVRRRRLSTAQPRQVPVRRARYRRGLSDRTWLVVDIDGGPAWVPVYWDAALERIGEQPVTVTAYGSPVEDSLIAFDVYGAMLWPSGRRRLMAPKGTERELDPPVGEISMPRQARADVVVVLLAPLLGLLWAYIDESGPAGFVLSTAMAAGLLFWLPSMYGSDPT
jgi:hypothetical protein